MNRHRDLFDRAVTQYEHAAKALQAATMLAFPIGCVVLVTLGGHRLEATVEGHGSWWSDPARIAIRNNATGKSRRCSASDQSCAIQRVD